ncbi:MAG: 7-cyano-7-deazaguanine synthase QueC [Methylotenera sp.]|uniref:7-cyano-7-deazaguanine synthase QueC n=1 Tax=Methylophilaceae TaxID=32011 RepID=UPI000D4E05A9|nr:MULTISPECIES: 7-cyano-7-deazaguanine synthase QueC [Methylophilaceae]PPC83183.1 MAG: 7-cyano-7-deazaguanine synthase QueC [Methylotenera sp.]TXI43371.1 MAG: 7-cyano-7-deazaguanine synthase QueC [Methylophilus sp.]
MVVSNKPKAVILLSGGLDSSTVLAIAKSQGYDCYCLSLDYHQRHNVELLAAQRVARALGATEHKTVQLDLSLFGGSALTDSTIAVPEQETQGIPVTYVPARNTIMLSLALAWAEVLQSRDIFIGVNALDYSGYPDCRGEYVKAFQQMANLATKAAVEGQTITVHAPLIEMTKADIIRSGHALGLDYGLTVSCYQANQQGAACGMCDSCRFRKAGFAQAGVADPTPYVGASSGA